MALAGNPGWTDYTITLRARKLEGAEGFQVLFQTEDKNQPTWWNPGGWQNSQHGLKLAGADADRVELSGTNLKCYLNGRLIQQVNRTQPKAIHAVAGRDASGNELILDVVNTGSEAVDVDFDLGTLSARSGRATLLTSASPEDENSFDRPAKVAPLQEAFELSGTGLRRSLAPHSLTILRLKRDK